MCVGVPLFLEKVTAHMRWFWEMRRSSQSVVSLLLTFKGILQTCKFLPHLYIFATTQRSDVVLQSPTDITDKLLTNYATRCAHRLAGQHRMPIQCFQVLPHWCWVWQPKDSHWKHPCALEQWVLVPPSWATSGWSCCHGLSAQKSLREYPRSPFQPLLFSPSLYRTSSQLWRNCRTSSFLPRNTNSTWNSKFQNC